MRIKDLATRATKLLTGNAYMVVDNGTKVEKVDYAELAKQIITEYNTQTLAGSAQSVKSALDALNSKLTFSRINSGTINDPSEYPQGVYVQYVAGTVTGAPLDSAGVVITFSWANWYVVQLACVGSAMVWRKYSSDAWSNWTEM